MARCMLIETQIYHRFCEITLYREKFILGPGVILMLLPKHLLNISLGETQIRVAYRFSEVGVLPVFKIRRN